MPLRRDKSGGGTNVDGRKSDRYCSNCLIDGEFQNPEIDSAQKMKKRVKNKMKSMGFPGFLAGIFTKKIPKLERWRK